MSVTEQAFHALLEKSKGLPKAGSYVVNDYIENLFYTVLDFQMRWDLVKKAVNYYRQNIKEQAGIKNHQSLKVLLSTYLDNKEGNRQVAQYLWGNNHWTRIALLRRFIQYFDSQGINTQDKLREWAMRADFERDFKGKVHGAGYAIFKWLVMRQGVDTIKPDVWIHRFIEEAIGYRLSNEDAVKVLEDVAKEIGIKASELDLAIWLYMRAK